AMAVRGNALPIETVQGSSVDGGEFVVAREVVADAAVENLAVPYVARVFYADPNGDSGLGASAKDLASLFFPVGLPHVAAEVVDVNAVVVFYEGETDSVRGVVLDPSAVGDEGDDSLVADAVGGPAECAQVGVVQAVLVRACGELGVGVGDARVESGVSEVGVEVIG